MYGITALILLELYNNCIQTTGDCVTVSVVDPPELEYMTYMADNVNPALMNKEGASPSQEKEKEKSAEAKRDEKPPITVTMR